MSDTILNVHVVVFRLHDDALQVLLAPCAEQKNQWELPGTPVNDNESLEEAAARAIASHIDRREAYLEQLYTYGDPGRTPRRVISVVYFALVSADALRAASGSEAWYRLDGMPKLAYDHADIIAYALRRLHYKLEYSAVGFQLLPDEFTLSALQHTYELILGEKLDKRNFRRRIHEADIIEETNHFRTGEGRPARLYRYRPDAVAEVKARRLFP
jgi:hypothetical protein